MSEEKRRWQVPLADVALGPEEIEAVTDVLKSGWLSMGPKTEEFEHRFAQFLGTRHALAVANGTAALHLACEAVGLKEGDEVLCPALTFVATANAILYTGARPIFIDANGPHDLNLSVQNAAAKITERTKAIMVVHYGGFPCDMDKVTTLADTYDLKVIEDCAHAPGAVFHSQRGPRMAGTIGDVGCFSFFANKNLSTGEGGMVITKDDELAEKVRICRSHGMTNQTWDRHRGHSFSYDVVARGYNYRLDEMRAALGIVQLGRVAAGNAKRRELTRIYREYLQEMENLEIPFLGASEGSAHHLFPVLLRDGARRATFMVALAEQGIQTSIHYPPVHRFSAYRSLCLSGYDLIVTEDVCAREVTLPLFPHMSQDQLWQVIQAVKTCA
jgi:dTDP-4-amino-4,6-dideoxygalactose transaminase